MVKAPIVVKASPVSVGALCDIENDAVGMELRIFLAGCIVVELANNKLSGDFDLARGP